MLIKVQWQARMLRGDAIKSFLQYIERRLSSHTLKLYRYVLRRFEKYAPKNIENLTIEHIEQYLESLKNLANRSVNAHLACIKSYCNFIELWYKLPSPAQKFRKLPEAPPKRRLIKESEYKQIVQGNGSIEIDVVRLLANTGLRSQEFQQLTPDNFSKDGCSLTIVGKGRKQRVVPLNKTCQKILDKYKPDMKLLKSYKRPNSLYYLCHRVAKKANVYPPPTPHSYRHFFADQLRRRGVSIYTISHLLGHATVKQTEQYLHWSDDDVIGATDVLDEI